ncbi:MAG: hypothetical protein JXC85_01120 [Candidatus Aenigmarchaeota archaeon]|nr:hypothetical protein [Candidatus Aenigmarchaeota archaeon]
MLRGEIEEKYGTDWWKRQLKMDLDHVVKLCVRQIDEKIPEILRCGVIFKHPTKPKRYKCVHKWNDNEYTTLVFIPTNHSNIVITGFSSNPEDINMFERIRGGGGKDA